MSNRFLNLVESPAAPHRLEVPDDAAWSDVAGPLEVKLQTVPAHKFQSNPDVVDQVCETLHDGKIVCVPTPSGYKLMADISSPETVMELLQAKCRMKNAPALVFIPHADWVDTLADSVSDKARRLIDAFWPGPVTLLFRPSDYLHPKVRKALTKAKGWLGMRVPDDPLSQTIIERFGGPVLVSSANLATKKGAHSVAQVKKNFGRTLSYLVDAGDIPAQVSSTLVDVSEDEVTVVRSGMITEDAILGALTA